MHVSTMSLHLSTGTMETAEGISLAPPMTAAAAAADAAAWGCLQLFLGEGPQRERLLG